MLSYGGLLKLQRDPYHYIYKQLYFMQSVPFIYTAVLYTGVLFINKDVLLSGCPIYIYRSTLYGLLHLYIKMYVIQGVPFIFTAVLYTG